jgi:hypothetical protein
MPTKRSASNEITQIKVTLKGIAPPIWRRLMVAHDITLGQLHDVIQIAMGWDDVHMHLFTIKGKNYGMPDDDGWSETHDEEDATLNKVAPKVGDKFLYEYDFGDSWTHEILIEKHGPREPGTHYPTCVKGKRRGPPEDCGGVYGYAEFLEARADPAHPQHEEMQEWFEGEFDPGDFDLDAINRELKKLGA